jgi:uncharacterized protein (TIGR03067 family)
MEEQEALAGLWQIVKAELAGDDMPAFVAEKIEVEISAGKYCVRFDGQVSDRGAIALETTGAMKSMKLTGEEGTNAGRLIPAIYQLAGDRLRICYGLDGIVPTRFETVAGTNHFMATYRRKPK